MQESTSIADFWAIFLVLKINCENGGYIYIYNWLFGFVKVTIMRSNNLFDNQ
jgi:hypothetical protein